MYLKKTAAVLKDAAAPPIQKRGPGIALLVPGICLSLLLSLSLMTVPLRAEDTPTEPDTAPPITSPTETPEEETPGTTEESLPVTEDTDAEPESSEMVTPPETGDGGALKIHAHIFGEGPVLAGVGKILFDGDTLTVTGTLSELSDRYHLSFNSPEPGVLVFLFYSDIPLPEGDALLFQVFFRSGAPEARQFTILLTDMTVSGGGDDILIEDVSFDITVMPGQPVTEEDSSSATGAGTSAPPESDSGTPGTDTDGTEESDTDRPHTADTGVTDPQGTGDETSHGGTGGSGIATVLLLIVLITAPILVITYIAFSLISKKKQQKGPKK